MSTKKQPMLKIGQIVYFISTLGVIRAKVISVSTCKSHDGIKTWYDCVDTSDKKENQYRMPIPKKYYTTKQEVIEAYAKTIK